MNNSVRAVKMKCLVWQHVRISEEKVVFCERRRTEFQHGNISDPEGNKQDPATRLRAATFKSNADTGPVLSAAPDSSSRPQTCRFKTDKILDNPVRRCTLEYLVHWNGYSRDFHSGIAAYSVINVDHPQHFYVTLHNKA